MKNMTTKSITICDVCKKEATEPHGWARLSLSNGWCGPHPFLSGPHQHQHDAVSREVDVCSAECSVKWLRERIEKIEANAREWAEWKAGEKKRADDHYGWQKKNDADYKARVEAERKAKELAEKEEAERKAWVDAQRQASTESRPQQGGPDAAWSKHGGSR